MDETREQTAMEAAIVPQVRQIRVTQLWPHPANPRKDIGDVSELAESIKTNGVLQNLTVVPDGETYVVVIGHRRLAAAKLAGMATVPCAVVEMDPEHQLATMLAENIQRQALTTYEEAKGFEQLRIDFGRSVSEIATAYGFSESTVRSRLKLAQLDQAKFQAAEARGGRLQDYAALDKIEDPETRDAVLDTIGTANFDNALKKALKQQEQAKKAAELEAQAAKFAKKIDKPDWTRMEHVLTATDEIKAPADAGTTTYYYVVSLFSGVALYRDKQETDDHEEVERQRWNAAHGERKKLLQAMAARHFELRRDFVRDLTVKKDHFPALHTFCADTFMGLSEFVGAGRVDPDLLGYTTHGDIGAELASKKDWAERKKAAFDAAERRQIPPAKMLLCAAYATMDAPGLDAWDEGWNSEARRYEIRYHAPARLVSLYKMLEAMGYPISDEERQMMDGTHSLLQEE